MNFCMSLILYTNTAMAHKTTFFFVKDLEAQENLLIDGWAGCATPSRVG
jgi:hypothetical protein